MNAEIIKRDEKLPITYTDPHDENVYWVCDYDADGKIVSVFIGHGDKYTAYMPSMEDVYKQEDMLIEHGWLKCKQPTINVDFDKKSLPRKYKRQLERKEKKQEKKK